MASGAGEAEKIAMNKLGVAFYMTSQGVPFFQAGEEILRSKPVEGGFHENSYNQPDSVNSIKWDDLNKPEYANVYEYYKGLIAFRKAHPALRLTTAAQVDANVVPVTGLPANVVAYNIATTGVEGETAEGIFAAFNATKSATTINLPEGTWNICVNGDDAGVTSLGTATGSVTVNAQSSVILVKGEVEPGPGPGPDPDPDPKPINLGLILPLAAVGVVAIAVVVVIVLKKKK
jgi:pullulanase